MSITALVLGAVLSLGLVGLAMTVSLHRERAFYAALLIAMATYLPIFAAQRFAVTEAIIHLGAAGTLTWLALAGFRFGGALLGLGFMGHAAYNLWTDAAWPIAPPLWMEMSTGFAIILALAARRFAR